MKNALILHGTEGHSKENWFPWLEAELTKRGYRVWVPDLPDAHKPNISKYNAFISKKWRLDPDSIIIGHSSGSIAALGLLQETPAPTKIAAAYLVAGFVGNLDWDALNEIGSYPLDWPALKAKAQKFVLFHSDDDPYVPLEHGKIIQKNLDAELIVLPKQKHFSVSTEPTYTKFPELLEKILE